MEMKTAQIEKKIVHIAGNIQYLHSAITYLFISLDFVASIDSAVYLTFALAVTFLIH